MAEGAGHGKLKANLWVRPVIKFFFKHTELRGPPGTYPVNWEGLPLVLHRRRFVSKITHDGSLDCEPSLKGEQNGTWNFTLDARRTNSGDHPLGVVCSSLTPITKLHCPRPEKALWSAFSPAVLSQEI